MFRPTPSHVFTAFLLVAATAFAAPPFPEALDRAAIRVEKTDDIAYDALILGNGDINALLYTEGGTPALVLTKNDVWDARLDSKLDPPLPTLELLKRLGKTGASFEYVIEPGATFSGPDSYHAHAYPCPRACARVVFGNPSETAWRQIRAEGKENSFAPEGDAGVMRIVGAAGASNGYALSIADREIGDPKRLRLSVCGTENARFFVDITSAGGGVVFSSGWRETPTKAEEVLYDLPDGFEPDKLILYTWTEDGKPAENRFSRIVFEGSRGSVEIPPPPPETDPVPAVLDIRRAVAATRASGPEAVNVEARALADRNVFLFRSSAGARLEPLASRDLPKPACSHEAGVWTIEQEIPGDADWPGMSFAAALVRKGDVAAVAIVTSLESEDPKESAVKLARDVLADSPDDLIRRHEAEWDAFWSVSGVAIEEPLLERLWYRNLYFLRCVSKPGVVSPGLFAGLINDTPAWHGDYHTNYNIQQTFWSALPANHVDLQEPYNRLIFDYLPRAAWLCKRIFDMEGAYYPHVLFAYEPANPAACKCPGGRQYIHHVWGMTLGVNAFSVQPVWWQYKYAPDREFLETTAYPLVREVARFQAAFVEQCEKKANGTVVLGPSVSPEHWGWTPRFEKNRDGTFDIAFFRYVFEAAIEGATILERDEDLVARWKAALARLPDYPTTGGESPVVVDVKGAPPITYNIAVPAAPVFPGDVVTWWSPAEEKTLFARTIESLRWNGNNATVCLAVARARLSMPGTLEWMVGEFAAREGANGLLKLNRLDPPHGFNDFGHYTEQFGATFAVSELLLQSVGDVLRLFPAWPRGKPAAFRGLRAQGGFLVDADFDGKTVTRLEVASTAGGPLRVLSPWKTILVVGESGSAREAAKDARGVAEVVTRPGERLVFRAGASEKDGE